MKSLVILVILLRLAVPPAAADPDHGSFLGPAGELRGEPDANSRVIATLPAGTPFAVRETRGPWLRVEILGGNEGWIRAGCAHIGKNGHPLAYAVSGDIDGDGAIETVGLEMTSLEGSWAHFRFAVARGGRIVWRDTAGAIGFVRGDCGSDRVELSGDLSGAGRFQILVADAHTDFSPAPFRLIEWAGGRLVATAPFCLLTRNDPPRTLRRGTLPGDGQGLTWVMSWKSLASPGRPVVDISRIVKDGAGSGVALLAATGDGYSIVKYLEPFTRLRH